jgi:hypothetical protein
MWRPTEPKPGLSPFPPHQSLIRYIEFQIGDERDLVSILACMVSGIDGKGFTFNSIEGRKISSSSGKEGKREMSILTINLQYGRNPGKLTLEEATKLAAIAKEILGMLGYSDENISQNLNRVIESRPPESRLIE